MNVDLAGYRIDSVVGHGGMATVYRAEQLSLGREVALKILAPELAEDEAFRERFLRESRLAARLDHPGVVPIYDAGEAEGVLYIAMRLVAGSDLGALLRRDGALPVEQAIAVLEHLAGALEAAHQLGLLHRDVKPANVLIEDTAWADQRLGVYLSDFGLARPIDLTGGSHVRDSAGSIHYISPERIRGEPEEDTRSDIYSLGCLLYECLTGRAPFVRDSSDEVAYAHLRAAPPHAAEIAKDVPPGLDEVIAQALSKSAEDRPTSALELADAAARAAGLPRTRRAETGAAWQAPLPARPVPDVVGRLDEEAVLLAGLRSATAGRGQLVLLSGEAGIGKTTLATRLSEEAERSGVPTVWATGGAFGDAPPPYWHWSQVVRALTRGPAGAELLRDLGASAGWLAAITPELVGEIGAFDVAPTTVAGADGRFHVYDALRLLLLQAAGRGLVLVLDDLHLADDASLQALAFIAGSVKERGLLVVGTYREGLSRDAGGGAQAGPAPLLEELERSSTHLPLAGLDAEHVHRLISNRLETTDRLAARVQELTAGNPLFVSEMITILGSQGAGVESELDIRDVRLPARISEAITERLAPLRQRVRDALDLGSVIGTRFRVSTLAAAADTAAQELQAPLDEAVASGLLLPVRRSADTFEFSHGLVQTTLYESLPRLRRCEMHGAVAGALERRYDVEAGEGLAEIAFHRLEAAPVDGPVRALEFARRAADRAVETFAYDEAVTLYGRALELIDADRRGERTELLQSLGEAQMRAGDTEAARETLERSADSARAGGNPDAVARAALAFNIWGLTQGTDERLVRIAEEAVEQLERSGNRDGLLACAQGLLATALYWAPDAARRGQLAADSLALARAEQARAGTLDSKRVLAYVIGRYLLARWGPDSAAQDFALSDELVRLCRELGHGELEILARNWRVTELLEMGRFTAVEQEVARLEQMAGELRQPRAMVFLPLLHGSLAHTAGNFEEAERLNAESVTIGRRVRGSVSELAAMAQLLAIRLAQGRLAELEQPVHAIVSAQPTMAGMRAILALTCLQTGRREQARAHLDALVADGVAGLPKDNIHIVTLALLSEVAAELGDVARAADLHDWLAPFAGRWAVSPGAAALWPVDRSLAQTATVSGQYEQARRHIRDAREMAVRAGAQPSLALAVLEEARLAAAEAPDDAERVGRLARQARDIAQDLGMGLVVDAATLLDAAAA